MTNDPTEAIRAYMAAVDELDAAARRAEPLLSQAISWRDWLNQWHGGVTTHLGHAVPPELAIGSRAGGEPGRGVIEQLLPALIACQEAKTKLRQAWNAVPASAQCKLIPPEQVRLAV